MHLGTERRGHREIELPDVTDDERLGEREPGRAQRLEVRAAPQIDRSRDLTDADARRELIELRALRGGRGRVDEQLLDQELLRAAEHLDLILAMRRLVKQIL